MIKNKEDREEGAVSTLKEGSLLVAHGDTLILNFDGVNACDTLVHEDLVVTRILSEERLYPNDWTLKKRYQKETAPMEKEKERRKERKKWNPPRFLFAPSPYIFQFYYDLVFDVMTERYLMLKLHGLPPTVAEDADAQQVLIRIRRLIFNI